MFEFVGHPTVHCRHSSYEDQTGNK